MSKLLFSFLVAVTAVCGVKAEVVPDATGMSMTAQEWCRSVEAGLNLGNSLESCAGTWNNDTWTYTDIFNQNINGWETAWGNPRTTKAMIDAIKAEGFNAMRIPTLWWPHVTDTATMTIDPVWLARVKEVVDYCIENGMFVILNTHHDNWLESNCTYAKQQEVNRRFSMLWKNIAAYFAGYDYHLAFAASNEPNIGWAAPTVENLAVHNSYNQTFVDAVRSTGGRNYYRHLIVQTYSASPEYGLAGFVVPTDVVDNRLSVEFHYYTPYDYCGNCTYYYWGTKYSEYAVTPSGNETTLNNLFDHIKKKWWDKGLGVVIGEYGVSNHFDVNGSKTEQRLQRENMQYYLSTVSSAARRRGFAALAWDNSRFGNGPENFGIFNRKANMRVDNTYFLNGILEGAKTEYAEQGSDIDPDADEYTRIGITAWEGRGYMSWGNGLQLKIAAYNFSSLSPNSLVVLYYELDSDAQYSRVEFYDGKWQNNTKLNINNSISNTFDLRRLTGQTSGKCVSAFTIPAAALAALQAEGMVIQGYGATLTKVVLVENAAITYINKVETTEKIYSSVSYNICGQRVDNDCKGIIIRNGRKYIN